MYKETKEALIRIANRNGLSVSEVIRRAIKEFIYKNDYNYRVSNDDHPFGYCPSSETIKSDYELKGDSPF
ncbi:MAG TPA: ribbon-helix-helix domain-containing protein [Coleofasciculaceae cyanobacterium]|jgi:hypothetical protein